jgi:hypothetical protein
MPRWMPQQLKDDVPVEHMLFNHFGEQLMFQEPEPEPPPNRYSKYQDDWLKLAEEQLGEWYTEDIWKLSRALMVKRKVYAQSANGTGKTHVAARLAISFFLTYPDAQAYVFAAPPESNLRRLLWGEIGRIIELNKDLFKGFQVSIPGMSITRHSLSFLTGVTIPVAATEEYIRSRFSGKHAPHMLFIGDEADAIAEPIFKAIEGCMSGGLARLLLLFNPKMRSGYIWDQQTKGAGETVILSAFNHPNVIEGEDLIPGAVSRNLTVQRINNWTRPVIDGEKFTKDEVFDVPEYLIGCVGHDDDNKPYPPLEGGKRKIVDPDFATVVLARYPLISAQQLITWDIVLAAQERWKDYVRRFGERPPVDVPRPTTGLDVAELGEDLNVFTPRYKWWVARYIEWGGVDVLVTGDRAAAHCRRLNALWCNVDSTGIGAGVVPQMHRRGFRHANRIMVGSTPDKDRVNLLPEDDRLLEYDDEGNLRAVPGPGSETVGFFANVRSMMMWRLREWLRTDPRAAIPDCQKLAEELTAPIYIKDNFERKIVVESTQKIKDKLPDHRSPDRLVSLALTFAPSPKKKGGGGGGGSINYLKGVPTYDPRDRGRVKG